MQIERDEIFFDRKEKWTILIFCLSIYFINMFPALATPVKYLVLPICLVLLFNSNSFEYLIFPLLFLDDTIGTFVAGRITLIWIYFVLVFLKQISRKQKQSKRSLVLDYSQFVLLVMCLYFVLVGLSNHGMVYLKILCSVICALNCRKRIERNHEEIQIIQYIIICSAMVTAISIITGHGGQIEYFNRRLGFGFTDPNYGSSLCLVGLGASLFLQEGYNKLLKLVLPIIFLIATIVSASLTGVTISLVLIIIKIWSEKSFVKKIKIMSTILLVVLIGVFLVLPRIGPEYFYSIVTRLNGLTSSSQITTSQLTTGRTDIAEIYLKYYFSQNPIKMLFGGNILQSQGLFSNLGAAAVTHNTLLDHLMVYGIAGFVLMYSLYIKRFYYYLRENISINEKGAILIIKFSVLLYSFTLAYLEVPFWWFVMII